MAAHFNITLDTTAPAGGAISIDGGAVATNVQAVNVEITTTDPDTTNYEILVWGDIDGGPATEGEAVWEAFTENRAVTLAAGDGEKTINVRIRDDVDNQTAILADTITLDTTAPAVTITDGPTPAKVSIVAGNRISTAEFTPDADIVAWEARVAPAAGSTRDQSTLIGQVNGSVTQGGAVAAATPVEISIDGRDLKAASDPDGVKIIKIFAQDDNGNWSV